jgi:hypothetical protein
MGTERYSEDLKRKIRWDLCHLPSAASVARQYNVPGAFVQKLSRQLPCRKSVFAVYDQYARELRQYQVQLDESMRCRRRLEDQLEERDIEVARLAELCRIHFSAASCKIKDRRHFRDEPVAHVAPPT